MKHLVKPDGILDAHLLELFENAEKNPNKTDIFITLGKALNLREYTCEARGIFENILEKEPDNNFASYEYIFAVGLEDDAMRDLAGVYEKKYNSKKNFITVRNLALIYHYIGETEKANALCEEMLALDDKDYTAYEVYAYLHFWQDQYDEALAYAKKGLQVKKDNCRSWRLVGHCQFEKNNLDEAEAAYKAAISYEEGYLRGWYSLGQLILNYPDRYAEGLQSISKAISINPGYWNSYFTMVNFYLGNKRHTEALAECYRILTLSPPPAVMIEAYNYLGLLYYSKGEHRKALMNFQKVLEKEPSSSLALYYIGQIKLKSGEPEQALNYFERSIEADPNFVWPYTQSGFALIELKQLDKATKKFNRALELDSNEYWAYMGLADIYRKNRKQKMQLDMMLKAAAIEPNDSDVQNRLAIAYECNQDVIKAEGAYLQSLKFDPMNRKAANNLGYLYEKEFEKTGNTDYKNKAIDAWKRRLLICRDTNSSMTGAINHLQKLDVRESLIEKWIEIGQIKEDK
ncbi:MAG: tetratricopeptide repeat protein [Acidobacteria bacterium]|nr:tetratricopeptide repeat protein [Acidobacteriota bacterium]